MPANRTNYIVLYRGDSQVYGAGSETIALETPPPEGISIEDKVVLFITYQPDNEILSVHKIDDEIVRNAELKYPKARRKKVEESDD